MCEFSRNYFYEPIETLIINQIKETFERYFKESSIRRGLLKRYNSARIKELEEQSKKQGLEARKITFKISELYNDRLNGEIGEEEYKQKYEMLTEARKKMNSEKEKVDLEIVKFQNKDSDVKKINKVKKIIKSLKSEDLTQEDIEELISKIELGMDYLCIHYKFEDIDSQKVSCCK